MIGRNMSLKNPVTPPGIDPGIVRLVAQRLNHYATPGPILVVYRTTNALPVPVVARSPAEIVGSNPTGGHGCSL
jgi:hypothetical protein